MASYCLVMAGGKGTRFWPESTSKKPKQYLSLVGENTLLSDTLDRFEGFIEKENRYIVTVKEQEELALQSSKERSSDDALIFEPSGRNTAPCILLSLAALEDRGASDDDVVIIVPSDHVILNKKGFQDTVLHAESVAKDYNSIVTIGINPHFPHTGYGYIHKSNEVSACVFKVQSFKEKPNSEVAKEYVSTGEYLWNAGMFVATLGTLKNEFQKHCPAIFESFSSIKNSLHDFSQLTEVYNSMPSDSIDYAIMEKSDNVMVIPAEFDWNDLGSWDALESVVEKRDHNFIASSEGAYFDNAKGNIIYTPGKHVSLINVDDLIIVSNERSVMILPKKDGQKVKDIVGLLKESDNAGLL